MCSCFLCLVFLFGSLLWISEVPVFSTNIPCSLVKRFSLKQPGKWPKCVDGLILQCRGGRECLSMDGLLAVFINKRLPCLYLSSESASFKSVKGEISAFCLRKSYGKHRNMKCSLCLMYKSISRQVAFQSAQIKQNCLAQTYQRRNKSQVVGPGADGQYLLKASYFFLAKCPPDQTPSFR